MLRLEGIAVLDTSFFPVLGPWVRLIAQTATLFTVLAQPRLTLLVLGMSRWKVLTVLDLSPKITTLLLATSRLPRANLVFTTICFGSATGAKGAP